MMKKKKKKVSLFDILNTIFMCLVIFIMVYPMYFTVIASLSDPKALSMGEVLWKPVGLSLDAYKQVFEYEPLWTGYANSALYTVTGTIFSLILTIPMAYALSKKMLPYKSVITTILLISMYFGGGMVPTYLLIKNLGLLNTRLVLIIFGGAGVSMYNVIVTRTYFETSIADSLYEAADVDGCSEIGKFIRIAMPLAKPIIAVMTLYYAVGIWNNYFSALLYVNEAAYQPLQLVLRDVLIMSQDALSQALMNEHISADALMDAVARAEAAYTMKYAVVFIASAPLLMIYPFIQKYFVKGVMIGSVKG